MLVDLLFFGIGLIVGWNFLPQPNWIKSFVTRTVDTVKGWFRG